MVQPGHQIVSTKLCKSPRNTNSSDAQLVSLFHQATRKPKEYSLGAQALHSCFRGSTELCESPRNTYLELKWYTVVLVVPPRYEKAQGILVWSSSDAQLFSFFHEVMQKPKEYSFGDQAMHSCVRRSTKLCKSPRHTYLELKRYTVGLFDKKQRKIAKTDVQYLSCVHAALC